MGYLESASNPFSIKVSTFLEPSEQSVWSKNDLFRIPVPINIGLISKYEKVFDWVWKKMVKSIFLCNAQIDGSQKMLLHKYAQKMQ